MSNHSNSIRSRLLNLARASNRPFNELVQYYGMERFLYRLGQSNYNQQFVLKGALLFHVWDILDSRATRDIDLLALADNSSSHFEKLIREICTLPVDCEDGIIYDANTVVAKVMQTNREYEGIRVSFKAKLEGEKNTIPMQIDCGFGDKITPAPEPISYPVLLDHPTPTLCGYPVETVIAEKLHTMVEKGQQNSRIKDYHDVWVLLRMNLVNKKTLPLAIQRTFQQRGMTLDWDQALHAIHLYGTSDNGNEFWSRYRKKGNYETTPENIEDLCGGILEKLSLLRELAADFPEEEEDG